MIMRLSESEFHLLVENCVRNVLNEMSPSLLSQEQVIQQFINTHGEDRYDYSRVTYVNGITKVIIGCNRHYNVLNDMFWFKQTPKHTKEEMVVQNVVKAIWKENLIYFYTNVES